MDRQSQGTTEFKTIEEILGSLKITEEYALDENKSTKLTLSEEMLIVFIPVI